MLLCVHGIEVYLELISQGKCLLAHTTNCFSSCCLRMIRFFLKFLRTFYTRFFCVLSRLLLWHIVQTLVQDSSNLLSIFNILHAVFDKCRMRTIDDGPIFPLRLIPRPVLVAHGNVHGTVFDSHPRVTAQPATEPLYV